jgi:O-antigen ligase
MRLVAAGEERGPYISSAVVLGALALLTLTVFTGTRPLETAPVIALTIIFALAYRSLLAWDSLLAVLVLVILFIPIQRYVLPGSLPFELEPYRLLVAFIVAGWTASLLVDPRVKLLRTGLEFPVGLIVVAVLGSIVGNAGRVAEREPAVVKGATFLLSFFLLLFLIASVVRTTAQVDRLLRVLVGGGAILAAFAILESRTQYNVFSHLSGIVPLLEPADFSVVSSVEERGARAYASAQHPIALGAALVMLIPPAVYLVRRSGRKIWWAAGALLMIGSLATLSRTSVLMLVAVAIVFLWLRPKQTKRLWPLLIPAVFAVHVVIPGTLGTLKGAFFPEGGLIAEQSSNPGSRGQGRVADLGPSLDEFSHQPLVGQGFATRVVDRAHPRPSDQILDDQWLGILLETGLVGFVGWLMLLLRPIRRLGRAAKEDDSDRGWLCVALAASLATYAIGMFTFDAFAFIQVSFIVFILLGLAVATLAAKPADETA